METASRSPNSANGYRRFKAFARLSLAAIVAFETASLFGAIPTTLNIATPTWIAYQLLFYGLFVEATARLIRRHADEDRAYALVGSFALLMLAIDAPGNVFGWYEISPALGTLTHAVLFPFAVAAWATAAAESALAYAGARRNVRVLVVVSAFALGMTLSAAHEISELLFEAMRVRSDVPFIMDRLDTSVDLLAHAVGTIAFLFLHTAFDVSVLPNAPEERGAKMAEETRVTSDKK
ncbi:MAG: hypothetical protein GF419_14595 [Ignavibacteriales bacterium]|nr:hypothetical protein [Ignavibacteriales bacterium]